MFEDKFYFLILLIDTIIKKLVIISGIKYSTAIIKLSEDSATVLAKLTNIQITIAIILSIFGVFIFDLNKRRNDVKFKIAFMIRKNLIIIVVIPW
jgi:hypothetical protein